MANTMRLLLITILLSAILVPGQLFAADHPDSGIDTNKLTGKDSAAILLDQALDLMKADYYEKNSVVWDNLVTEAKRKLVHVNTCSDSYSIISECFKEMKANHSFIIPGAKTDFYADDANSLKRKPRLNEMIGEIKSSFPEKDIVYLTVPWVCTTNPDVCSQVADSLQQLIESLDKKGISKWIVDLRMNTGGNYWPMLAGMGPLLGNSVCGFFVFQNSKTPFSYKDGNALNGNRVICAIKGKPYTTKKTEKYIAVLVGPNTSSSGELVALAFKGLPNTEIFGEPTAGFTTANTSFRLLDQSMLVLTVCMEADRSGAICKGKIIPDNIVTGPPSYPTDDPVKIKAIMWLQLF